MIETISHWAPVFTVLGTIIAGALAWYEKRRPEARSSKALRDAKLRLEFLDSLVQLRKTDIARQLPPQTYRTLDQAKVNISSELEEILIPFRNDSGEVERDGATSKLRILTLTYWPTSFIDVLLRMAFFFFFALNKLFLLGMMLEASFDNEDRFYALIGGFFLFVLPMFIFYSAAVFGQFARRNRHTSRPPEASDTVVLATLAEPTHPTTSRAA